jgi:aspartokinase/homoserine dehydrogenase 1
VCPNDLCKRIASHSKGENILVLGEKDMAERSILTLKFGGTSMGNHGSIARVMKIVRETRAKNDVVTIVSAMSGVTDSLLDIGRQALLGKRLKVETGIERLGGLHEKHFHPLANSVTSRGWIGRFIENSLDEIKSLTEGVLLLHEFSERTKDKLLSYGEILSSSLLARVMHDEDSAFRYCDARKWLIVDWSAQGAIVDMAQTERQGRRHLLPMLKKGFSPIIPGFICKARDGQTATLGRNGSDYSAAIVGAILRSREIWIYTDVDGIMTADPNLVSEAAILRQVSYQEAAEMSYLGAKVVHPKTMIPAVLHKIPIRIKNTFNPGCPGTLITDRSVRTPLVKTVTSARDMTLLNIQGNGMVGIPRMTARIFDLMARENVDVIMISQSSSEHSICLLIPARNSASALRALREEFRLEIERGLIEEIDLISNVALVSVIGAGMQGQPGTSGKFFDALGRCRINVLAIAQGSSELNISAVVREKDYKHAVQAIHTAFGLTRDLYVFLFGCGNIGRTLLKQIHDNRKLLAHSLQVNLKVLGVANSRTWKFSHAGLTSQELQSLGTGMPLDRLDGCSSRPSSEEIFEQLTGTYRSDVVLVDATAAELAPAHILALRRGFHVVTANKKPLTSRLADYAEIQKLRRQKGLNYQYEATFGAGLPLLSTLQDLINTGDQIIRVQGCLSGTLGFICSKLDEGKSLSQVVAEAVQLGYTEPDPREDLSGADVARKSLIISRELGIFAEPEATRLKPMLPMKFFRHRSVDDFLANLCQADAPMNELVRQARKEKKVLRYVVDIRPGEGCEVGLKKVPGDSPIGSLRGPDNILVFQTQRYYEHPLVIQGPGAGAGVTAAGVLGDLLKIAKWI